MKRTKDEDKEEAPAQPAAHNSSAGSNGHEATSPVATTASAATSSAAVSDASIPGASVRTTGRVKKPKQVYDPSDNYVSRASSNRNSLGATGASSAAAAAAASTGNVQSPPANATAKETSDSQESTPSPAVSEQQAAQNRNFDTCQKCGKSEPKRGSGHKSNFLTCKGCMQKWHFPCLPINFQNQSTARKKYKCEKCRYCQVCNVRGRDLPICSVCVEAYHADCNDPTIKQFKVVDTNPKWKCFRCEASNSGNNTSPSSEEQTGGRKSNASRDDPPVVPRKSNAGRKKRVQSDPTGQEKPAKIEKLGKRSPLLKADEKKDKKEEKKEAKKEELREQPAEVKLEKIEKEETVDIEPVQTEIHDQPEQSQESSPARLTPPPPPPPPATAESPVDIKDQPVATWSVEQVVGFVAQHYPKEANVFRYQDIDGASLLLLTRQDVMNGFGLKLGPALRVFELVMSLQSRSDDVRLAWFE
ncbi:histone-lysine N-methyltransferase 2D [Drosophila subpulchrella]|uniref:histone-lysine N-methyltransferase 2D n=1 Tax=Drosophila subpulchrella TaxID=1486046 RepID=UPI0018A16DFF|nr:histone-lysine N-methyltransferase 2D [Drosophila subpulchrella]